MKPVVFNTQKHHDFYKALQLEVKTLMAKESNGNLATKLFWFKVLFYYSGFVLSWLCVFQTRTNAAFLFFYLINGLFVLGIIFNVAHDAAHNTIFKSRKWNSLMYYISFPLLGNNPYVWRRFHVQSHHLYTNVEESDIDVVRIEAIRLNPSQQLKSFHRFQHVYAPLLYLFYSLNFIFIRDVLKLMGKSQRTITVAMDLKHLVGYLLCKLIFITIFIVIPLLFGFNLWLVLVSFVASQFLNSLVIVLVLSCNHQVDLTAHLSHAEAEQNLSWVELQLKANLDYSVDSKFWNFVVGGFNAHTVHHLLPHINHTHYLKIVPILKKLAIEYGVQYNHVSHKTALKSHFRYLYAMGH
jgi:linoleoyl-CoA desaturase